MAQGPEALEPFLVAVDVGRDELLVTLGEVDDPLDQADQGAKTAGDDGDDDAQDPSARVTQNKTVDAKPPPRGCQGLQLRPSCQRQEQYS